MTELYRHPSKSQMMINKQNEVEYLTFPLLTQSGIVKHLFSTRVGGVSKDIYASMNFSYTRGDDKEAVDENYRRIAKVLDCEVSDIVCSDQTHTTNIRLVTGEDGGKGVVIPKDYHDIDGLITNEPGIVLATFFADCVPLYFVDVKHKAIGLAHSGWRGTVAKMGNCMVERMHQEFGSDPKDILAAIGPSICMSCYEVSEDVAEEFKQSFAEFENCMSPEELLPSILYNKGNGKYQLDLWKANEIILLQAGILPEHIQVTDLCTCHNSEYLFSHRASNGKRGNLAAFLGLVK